LVSRRLFLRVFSVTALISLASLLGIPLSYKRRSRVSLEEPVYGSDYMVGDSMILLPLPVLEGGASVEEALASRRSIREYLREPILLEELSQILWAAYGITETRYGFKTTPSAGATYPLEVYAVIGENGVVTRSGEAVEPGSYKYDPYSHSLRIVKKGGGLTRELYEAALEQEWILEAPVNLVFTAVFERTTRRYGKRGERYVWIEAGHASQNVYLQATSLGLATVAIGAFYDDRIREIIGARGQERVLYMMTLARPAKTYELPREELARFIEGHRRALRIEARE
jgi:SagB-type dehydrogenase family enzyme